MPSALIRQILKLGLSHHSAGRLVEAEKLYQAAVAREPSGPDALHLLGVLSGGSGRATDAMALIQRAIEISPHVARYHSDLGNVLCELGEPEHAIDCYRRAIELDSQSASHLINLGAALRDCNRLTEAIEAYHRALALDPCSGEAHNNLGVALMDEGRLDQAIGSFRRAIQLKGDYADAYTNLGIALYANRRGDDAVAACREAVEMSPSFAKAHSNLALILLGTGHCREGWGEHEWRWKCNPKFKPRDFAQPQWDGSSPDGKTILVYAEQGLGDTIQFSRYVPLVAKRAGRVILECQAALARLMESLQCPATMVLSGQPLPAFDTHCPLMSLPYALGADSVVADIPYLHPRPCLVDAWREKLGAKSRLRVGIAWAGRPTHSNDRNRSMPPENLGVLAKVDGIEWHSLQKQTSGSVPKELRFIDHSCELNDFADTSAVIANLDLVISVDTAVAHLAGAMGKTTWLLLPYVAEWRWMLDRADSPWYPTMRLFRQERWGDWLGVMRRVVDALQSEW
jgi:Flp pilus assembly protein TadD